MRGQEMTNSIVKMHKQGLTAQEIAEMYCYTVSTVYRHLKKEREYEATMASGRGWETDVNWKDKDWF